MSVPGHSERSSLTQLSASGTTGSHSLFYRTAVWSSHPSNLLRKEEKGATSFRFAKEEEESTGSLEQEVLRARAWTRLSYVGQRCLGQSSGMGQELNCKVN